jgi:hypothetical protein
MVEMPMRRIGLMNHKTGCLVCGGELVYSETTKSISCFYCGSSYETNAACTDGHFVCDACHSSLANDLIEKFCIHTQSTDPIAQAILLMNNPSIKMHGPEHHFLVPAVLLSSWFNQKSSPPEDKADAIRKARKRAEDVKGGFCGFHGACGSAIGTGIFVSVLTGSTPLAKNEWRLSNLMTAASLEKIAESDGPRCCKRSSFLAIVSATDFLEREFGIEIPADHQPVCTFDALNRECHRENCRFFQG